MIQAAGIHIKKFISILTVILFCTLLSSCNNINTDTEKNSASNINIKNVFEILTEEKESVLTNFKNNYDDNTAGTQKTMNDAEKIHIKEKLTYNDISADVYLEFYNNRLLRVYYDFGKESEVSLKFAQEMYEILTNQHGQSEPSPAIETKIDGLTLEKFLSDHNGQYKEYWIDSSVNFEKLIPFEYKDFCVFDLGIGIEHYEASADKTKSIVYIGGIRRITDHKLWSEYNSKNN